MQTNYPPPLPGSPPPSKGSGGKILAGIITAVSILCVIAWIFSLIGVWSRGTHMQFGKNEIYYKGDATEADAKSLAKALQDEKYFDDNTPKTVLLQKGKDGTFIRYVVDPDKVKDKPEILDGFAAVTSDIAGSVGGKPITFTLVDPHINELNSRVVK